MNQIKESKLTLHCGGYLATRETVQQTLTPAATASWQPIAHGDLIACVETALAAQNMRVVTEAFALAKNGTRFFGLLQVALNGTDNPDYGYVVSLRNGHDKTWKILLGVGSSVFVCDNLAFSAEIQVARKHTRHMFADLPRLVSGAVGQLAERWSDQGQRIEAYRGYQINNDAVANDFIIRAYEAGVVPVTVIPDVLREWRSPRHEEFKARTAWSLFNSFTECLKPSDTRENSVFQLPKRTTALHGLMDAQVGLLGRDVKVINN